MVQILRVAETMSPHLCLKPALFIFDIICILCEIRKCTHFWLTTINPNNDPIFQACENDEHYLLHSRATFSQLFLFLSNAYFVDLTIPAENIPFKD